MIPGRRSIALLALVLATVIATAATAGPALTLSADDREAITRVAIAEAGNQGESGMAAVVQTVLNRLASGAWGSSVEQVVNAPHQFEPVLRVGGDWRRLPAPTAAQRATVDTILALIADGRLPDFIGGALYFQNPRIVAARIAAGTTAPDRLNFGGRTPVAVVRDHAFYAGPAPSRRASPASPPDGIFVDNTTASETTPPQPTTSAVDPSRASTPPERGIFILPDGRLAQDFEAADPVR